MNQFCEYPVFAIVDVRPDVVGIPTTSYVSVEELVGEGKELRRVFKNIPCRIEAEEAEGVHASTDIYLLMTVVCPPQMVIFHFNYLIT